MLADDIAAAQPMAREAICKAHRLKFTAAAIDTLYGLPLNDSVDWTPEFRLPYSVCWFEMPNKTAFLVSSRPDVRASIGFMPFNQRGPLGSPRFPMGLIMRFEDGFCLIQQTRYHDPQFRDFTKIENWLAGLVMRIVLALNVKGLFAREHVDHTEYNVKRARKGMRPLLSHHICDLTKPVAPALAITSSPPLGIMRRHEVRGHLKARRTGKFWWQPFERGNAELGFISKDYKL